MERNIMSKIEEFLRENGVLEYVQRALASEFGHTLAQCEEEVGAEDVISSFASWADTEQGHDFWQSLHLKWVGLL
jgi:hypothetical protein